MVFQDVLVRLERENDVVTTQSITTTVETDTGDQLTTLVANTNDGMEDVGTTTSTNGINTSSWLTYDFCLDGSDPYRIGYPVEGWDATMTDLGSGCTMLTLTSENAGITVPELGRGLEGLTLTGEETMVIGVDGFLSATKKVWESDVGAVAIGYTAYDDFDREIVNIWLMSNDWDVALTADDRATFDAIVTSIDLPN